MKYLIAALLLLFPISALSQNLAVGEVFTASFFCDKEKTLVSLIQAPESRVDAILASSDCYAYDVPIVVVVKRYVGTYNNPQGMIFIDVYEVTSIYIEGSFFMGYIIQAGAA